VLGGRGGCGSGGGMGEQGNTAIDDRQSHDLYSEKQCSPMSSFNTERTFKTTQEKASQACRYSLNEMQLAIKHDNGTSFTANEKFKMLGFVYPAKIEVETKSDAQGLKVLVRTSNLGFGPIQGGHVKGVAETFLSKLQFKLEESTSEAGITGIADELQKLAALKEQGILSDEEFAAAKAKLF